MIDMYAPLETAPTDGAPSVYVSPNRRYWPNPVSGEYCALISNGDHDDEHWYDDEGKPLDPESPAIRNTVQRPKKADLEAAFIAGAGIAEKDETKRRFDLWYEGLKAA